MTKPTDIEVILVRCGRTEWDDQSRLQGRTDLPLSEPGREAVGASARDLVETLGDHAPAVVHSGKNEASRQTAELVAGPLRAKVKTHEALEGMNLGVWDGLLESQLMERFPKAYRQWKDRVDSVIPPEGETFENLSHRLKFAMCRVLEKVNGRPAAFVLRPISYGCVTCWLGGRPFQELWSVLDDGPQTQRLVIQRDLIRSTVEDLKQRA